MKLLFVGGGSGGPVAPLLAVANHIHAMGLKNDILFVGTKNGPEAKMVRQAGFKFTYVASGKMRRYFSWENFISPFFIIIGFIQSIRILRKFKPGCVMGAGSYVQVPLLWAAFFLKIPIVIHQQDIVPSLSNQLCSLIASKITVTFESSIRDFPSGFGILYKKHTQKVSWTGNPFRENLLAMTKKEAINLFGLKNKLPVVLVLGGGTGASDLNSLINHALPMLTRYTEVIHSTGFGKNLARVREGYHPFEFIDNMGAAYAAADLVICRAGLSTITELSRLKKVSIIIPMPESHQELNAWSLAQYGAAVVVKQGNLSPEKFVHLIRKLLVDGVMQKNLQYNIAKIMPHNATEKIAEIVLKLSRTYA